MDDERDRVKVRNAVLAVTALAWAMSWAGATLLHHAAAGAAANWLLMLAAMMAPVLITPIQFVRASGLARRRTRSTLLFVAGYTAVWIIAGSLMLTLAAALRASTLPSYIQFAVVLVIALVWQCSPAKQASLNQCHARPPLAAFGRAADTDVLAFGVTHGAMCAASCWAWMFLPLLVPAGHMAAMTAAAILIFCERLDNPAPSGWRWRGLGKARRIVIAQIRIRMSASVTA
jgi:predicted metal-binding membrane protein